MTNRIVIDCFPDSASKYLDSHVIVVIDVIRATTTAVSGVNIGRRIFPVRTTDEAFILAKKLHNPLLAGELGGNVPYGFDLTNSPVQIEALSAIPSGKFTDPSRPIILLSSSGTQLMKNAERSKAVYIACFRNISAVAHHLAGRHQSIAIIGAGTRGEFRREDQMCCAWIAGKLIKRGYEPETVTTEEVISRWENAGVDDVRGGRSEGYLKRSGQIHDLEFILSRFDDLDVVPMLIDEELVRASLTIE